jgi:hypothetical protein
MHGGGGTIVVEKSIDPFGQYLGALKVLQNQGE